MDGSGRAERFVRWIARKLRLDEDKFAAVLHQVAERLEELISDRQLLRKVVFWATANWLLDAASLWVFLRAFGVSLSLDALLVAFGLANVLAAIPILPGGLGVVDATYLTTLVGFGFRGAWPSRRSPRTARAVPDADRARRTGLRVAAGRAVEDREAGPTRPAPRPGPGRVREGRVPPRLRTALR
jgi:hypothetical protein